MFPELSLVNVILGVLWLLVAIFDYADFCHILQLKEYRWDRFKDFLSTPKGKSFFRSYTFLFRGLLVLFTMFMPLNQVLILKYLIIFVFTVDLTRYFLKYIKNKIRRPRPTKKALLLMLLTGIVELCIIINSQDWSFVLLLLLIRFFLMAIVMYFLNQITILVKKLYVMQAEKKLSKYNDLLVIGITGSYGKTSVKTFLHQILSSKFKTVCTPKNINTEIGIAKFILKQDFKNIDVFIVEMGAYNIGEIKIICDMVHPSIGVLTAINEQHLSLFGSIKNTQTAKYELLRSLPKTGLAIVNSDNKYCREYLPDLDMQIKTFGKEVEYKPNILVEDIINTPEGIECTGRIDEEKYEIKSSVAGEHNATNLAPCILIAKHLGMDLEEIKKQALKLEMPRGTLRQFIYGDTIILDDSYNSNPDGFKSALHVLATFPSDTRRVVITRGMLELGEESYELHQKIAEEISFCADELILISRDYEKAIRAGIVDKYKTKLTIKNKSQELLDYVKSMKNTKTVILVENRIPTLLYKEIIDVKK
jgi:UDP-N-acetylmuramoyl-tripeptide--D-alanyl-D-alanine ligase